MRQRARFAIDERTTTYDERLEKHVIGDARDSRGPPVMAAPTADCELPTASRRLWRPLRRTANCRLRAAGYGGPYRRRRFLWCSSS